ncbi:MAG: helix-turn-helix domain-containing protein [Gemmatimonadetes bacterium]|nr:helix-turn-helix domain-containing protein [Gemmatimonadota bacterium]
MTVRKSRLAKRLRSARVELGLTQAEVARNLGLHRPAISEIEAGRRSVNSEELYRFSRLYRIQVSQLLDEAPPGRVDAHNSRNRRRTRSDIETSIARMARIIADRFDPERIILFGSHGRGAGGPESDVDLLIVMDVSGSKRQKAVEIGAALHDISLAKDVIVTTPEEYEWRKHVVGTIERPAAREGRVLYERR